MDIIEEIESIEVKNDEKKKKAQSEKLVIYRVYSGKYTFGHYLNKKDAEYVWLYVHI
jgi:hypothetical protein